MMETLTNGVKTGPGISELKVTYLTTNETWGKWTDRHLGDLGVNLSVKKKTILIDIRMGE